jgi:hypothetical protein
MISNFIGTFLFEMSVDTTYQVIENEELKGYNYL